MIKLPLQYIEVFKNTIGAFSVCEGIALANICEQVPKGGVFAEMGTHKAKSTIASICGLPKNGEYFLVDPEFKNAEWVNEVWDNLAKANAFVKCEITFKIVPDYSLNFIGNVGSFSYVFVDSGSHGDGLPMAEAKLLEDRIVQGGILAFHDYKNQFTEVEQAYNYLLSTGKYEEVPINWEEIFAYVKKYDLERDNNSWHLYPELPHPPNFVGALKRK